MEANESVDVSVIVPVYNEQGNLKELFNRLQMSLLSIDKTSEIVFVDDGSTDDSFKVLQSLETTQICAKLIRFRRNFGQTAAMAAGLAHSKGKIVVFIDADLQNDPYDIPALLSKLDEGYDVVSGWRQSRKDTLLLKKIPSRIANAMIRKTSKVNIHDLGCSLKAYRREIIEEISIVGEMHRFLPVLAARIGARITEIPVQHHPRTYGRSNYGLKRSYKVILDLMTVQFFHSFSTKPIHLYGGFALISLLMGLCSGIAVILMKIFWGTDMTGNPILLLTVLFILITIILALLGIQSEILVRIYHQQGRAKQYYIRETHDLTCQGNTDDSN